MKNKILVMYNVKIKSNNTKKSDVKLLEKNNLE